MTEAMSSTIEWRKLADKYDSYGEGVRVQLVRALRAACDRLDEQANLPGIANEKWGEALARAEAAEALAADTQRDLNECSKRLVAAKARVAELERVAGKRKAEACLACITRLEAEEAKLKVAVAALSAWLAAYDATGPDNGPSLTEHECAKQARNALAKLKGEP